LQESTAQQGHLGHPDPSKHKGRVGLKSKKVFATIMRLNQELIVSFLALPAAVKSAFLAWKWEGSGSSESNSCQSSN
jgi:hypothetical protein